MFAKICIFATENQLFKKEGSRPTWACGLKLNIDCHAKCHDRHAPHGRVD